MELYAKKAILNGRLWNPVIADRDDAGDEGVVLPIGCTSYKQAMDYAQDLLERHAKHLPHSFREDAI